MQTKVGQQKSVLPRFQFLVKLVNWEILNFPTVPVFTSLIRFFFRLHRTSSNVLRLFVVSYGAWKWLGSNGMSDRQTRSTPRTSSLFETKVRRGNKPTINSTS